MSKIEYLYLASTIQYTYLPDTGSDYSGFHLNADYSIIEQEEKVMKRVNWCITEPFS